MYAFSFLEQSIIINKHFKRKMNAIFEVYYVEIMKFTCDRFKENEMKPSIFYAHSSDRKKGTLGSADLKC